MDQHPSPTNLLSCIWFSSSVQTQHQDMEVLRQVCAVCSESTYSLYYSKDLLCPTVQVFLYWWSMSVRKRAARAKTSYSSIRCRRWRNFNLVCSKLWYFWAILRQVEITTSIWTIYTMLTKWGSNKHWVVQILALVFSSSYSIYLPPYTVHALENDMRCSRIRFKSGELPGPSLKNGMSQSMSH